MKPAIVVEGFGGYGGITVGGVDYIAIEDAARLVRDEREACAKLVETLPAGFGDLNRNDVASRIRNRT